MSRRVRRRRAMKVATAVTALVTLAGCQSNPAVEHAEGLTYLRVHGEIVSPASLFEAVVYVGEGDCVYVQLPNEPVPGILALADGTSVSREGLSTEGGTLHAFGETLSVELPASADGSWETPSLPECSEASNRYHALSFFEATG